MINNFVSGFQLLMVMLSVSIIMYTILKGMIEKAAITHCCLICACCGWY